MNSAKELAIKASEAAFIKNAYQPELIKVTDYTSYADYVLILSGQSIRQVQAISEIIQSELKLAGCEPLGTEGGRGSQWILLDYASVIIHIFLHSLREYYDLDGFWSDAPRVQLAVPKELRAIQSA